MGYDPAELRNTIGQWTTGGSGQFGSWKSAVEGGGSGSVTGSYSGALRSEILTHLKSAPALLTRGTLDARFHITPKDLHASVPDSAAAAYEPAHDRIHFFANLMQTYSEGDRKSAVHHELFHRLDSDAGARHPAAWKSTDGVFVSAVRDDVRRATVQDKREYGYFMNPTEAYAEVSARVTLARDPKNRVLSIFRNSADWLASHLYRQGLR